MGRRTTRGGRLPCTQDIQVGSIPTRSTRSAKAEPPSGGVFIYRNKMTIYIQDGNFFINKTTKEVLIAQIVQDHKAKIVNAEITVFQFVCLISIFFLCASDFYLREKYGFTFACLWSGGVTVPSMIKNSYQEIKQFKKEISDIESVLKEHND